MSGTHIEAKRRTNNMTKLNTPTNRMVLIFECKIKNTDSFKTWSKDRAAKHVYDLKEENSISYEWHISQDGNEATLIEAFVDSDAMMVRLGNHAASPLATEVFEHVDIIGVLCLGNAKQDAIDALSAWGARFHSHHCGYNREIVGPR
tara:strand:+ start:513 stop:953 length:441 start_codon:yes stop_codon:yes gene_type:complete